MAHAFGQFALTIQALALAHLLRTVLYLVQIIAHFLHTAYGIRSHGIAELLQAELHIVEIGNRLAQRIGDVRKHRLEIAESHTGIVRILGIHRLIGLGIGNEHHDAPIVLAVVPVGLSRIGRNEREHFAFDVVHALLCQLLADMAGDGLDIGLQHLYILENGMIDALQHVVGSICFESSHLIGVIDQPAAQRLDSADCTLRLEMGYNGLEVIHDI